MKNKPVNTNREPRLDIPFTKWLSERLFTSEGFRDLAAKRGVKINLSTLLKWRMGTQPRKDTRAILERKFPGIQF
jgi:hypothetical protein